MNRERVQMLRDMIAGIPEKNINLIAVYRKAEGYDNTTKRPIPTCGTVACMWGWAMIYPPFVKAGIPRTNDWFAGTEWFDVPDDTFDYRHGHERGTDKEVALHRLDRLLKARTDSAILEAK